MRLPCLIAAMLTCFGTAVAGEIREFNIKTLEKLGDEITRVSQSSDRGATTPERKRARQTAMAAVKGRLFNLRYDYVVLDDPEGSGFLVYALGLPPKHSDIVMSGHFRVTVSADGNQVKRIDGLSHSVIVEDTKHLGIPKETTFVGNLMTQVVSNKPVETTIYTSNITGKPILVATPDGKMWMVANGKMSIDKSKPGSDSMGGAARMRLKEGKQ